MNALTRPSDFTARRATVMTRFVNRREDIPFNIRIANVAACKRVAGMLDGLKWERSDKDDQPPAVKRAESIRALGALWEHCETTFAAFDVRPESVLVDEYDRMPFRGGNYPKAPLAMMSSAGSPAGMCADLGHGG